MQRFIPAFGTGLIMLLLLAALWFRNPYLPSVVEVNTNSDDPSLTTSQKAVTQMAKPRAAIYYKAITERPLFAPMRRPEVEGAASEAPALSETVIVPTPTDTPAFALKGVMVVGDNASALIAANDAAADWLKTGATISGWTVTNIQPNWAELTLNSQKIRVELYPK